MLKNTLLAMRQGSLDGLREKYCKGNVSKILDVDVMHTLDFEERFEFHACAG